MTITEFLTARYDEEERLARTSLARVVFGPNVPGLSLRDDRTIMATPNAVLADIAAKRAIVADRVWPIGRFWDGQRAQHDRTLWLLAQPYADHPDFDPAWRA